MPSKSQRRAAFGDFQTPSDLAARVCEAVRPRVEPPRTIVEPTCGVGNLLVAARSEFGPEPKLIGVETNATHLAAARRALEAAGGRHELVHRDFFEVDWAAFLEESVPPILVVGNPPWVTNAELGALGSNNLPVKKNTHGLRGLDALTGKSNFDISEWMCIRLLEVLAGRRASLALLLKTAVARKVLAHAWTHGLPLRRPRIFEIDAKAHFGASVDACLFTAEVAEGEPQACSVFRDLRGESLTGTIGWESERLIADVGARARTRTLTATESDSPQWRSGIKHDCARVLELRSHAGRLTNGLDEVVEVESAELFPLQKSSDVAGGRGDAGKRLIVTQRTVGQATEGLRDTSPRLWAYLEAHGKALDARKSSIYRGKPRFSIFGVGEYTFTPWKVAISGLYKKLEFRLVGPVDGQPVVFDDTVYFLPFEREEEAAHAHEMLCSAAATLFFEALIFWDAKRPITAALLRRLSLDKLAAEVR